MKVEYTKSFLKQHKKLPRPVQLKFQKRLRLLCDDPQNPLLRNHGLLGKYQGYRSINITGDIRAIYMQKGTKVIVMMLIGSHSELYK